MPDHGSLVEVVEAIRAADRIGVVGHVGPDGDALGSMIGLALAATDAGKSAVASFDHPFVVPDEMDFLDTSVLVRPEAFPSDLDLAIAVDCSVPKRVGSLIEQMSGAKAIAVIDHHLAEGDWGDHLLIDRTAAATTELIHQVIGALGWSLTAEVATALYTGLVTDTGRFQYSSTTPHTHRVAAELLAAGVRPDVLGQKLFEENDFGYYTVASRVLGRAVLDINHRFVWSVMTSADLAAGGIAYHQADDLIDLVRMARGSEVACLLKEHGAGSWKGSLRSRGRVDVAAIASIFSGGGHHNAAGFTTDGEPADIIGRITAALA
ncbi:MAG: bifunctional oligoribonuclease/PAP phosphatase NrnA [Acidimicrobiia bacterium]|nr:bifunctional oligoribonuclease/PAP phosphatase NrnA [Acidimicrobiia bacterium]